MCISVPFILLDDDRVSMIESLILTSRILPLKLGNRTTTSNPHVKMLERHRQLRAPHHARSVEIP